MIELDDGFFRGKHLGVWEEKP